MNIAPITTARITARDEGLGRTEHTLWIDRPVPRCEARGHVPTVYPVRHRRRVESWNHPTSTGLDGPVWDGDAPRHKGAQAFRRLPA